ncbi:ferredoxin [Paenibacillus sp. IB182496]|uniref:Ferredoxin n=1 Tax=Paenibacillus sabuli TaxID=2772509 RepID=A0A927BSE2_9BACL|nr:ferredoxin [Paenibacillus sabuli]MBD2844568.1 ferredoxin [Paenibacillus sabuli]
MRRGAKEQCVLRGQSSLQQQERGEACAVEAAERGGGPAEQARLRGVCALGPSESG